ncbi:glutamine--fructose-6-phosphate aminotransferase (isomerizing) [Natronomonas pharaonis DSM 2160]|uniref:Glutamine--fructose-6-phosphate aminotransferase [isomerizing] n=1 Tax=Natronomonas pharaonis (strain ATCC 35678 / DSM 2160 / CIP 103997 / JCM 8858 / NBRC 14720 / NCIMB 2260 / Gabara) TaxID=348780 RepID=A0A1U7EYS6_NATPD|nr:glutamine--fructose-6-phosphate transaminase (isomerizing) [Natronomonas pharaonis]CAI50418.1 glutamine--fructose-6-phosphate aminotransferase (isomerizing) [Natronomonas pharaonis DSM 2160]
MCGITGYVGDGDALAPVLDGLRNLEYRGYDSAGIALVDGGAPSVYKTSGEVDALVAAAPDESEANCAIGHTRWSTHGPPTDTNAHPHTDCTEKIAVVHNGIIENYETLQADLDDHTFTSETDTEVIPHLLEERRAAGDAHVEAVQAVTDRLDGSYAFCVVFEDFEGIIAVRHDSPLVVGHGETGAYVASDVTGFLDRTRQVSYLEDNDIAVLDGDVTVYRDGERIDPAIETIEWEADAAEKGGYEHYMRKEIHEQPQSLRQTIAGRLDVDGGDVDLDVSLSEEQLQSLDEIEFVACGTSYYAGLYAARLFETLADVRASVTIASEYDFGGGRDPWRTLTVAVTQSGETADTLSAIRAAKQAGAQTLAVTNTLGSTVTREVDDSVFIRAGPEIGVAATKTFASQVATLALLAVYVGRRRNALRAGRASTLLENLRALPGAVQQVLDNEPVVEELADTYADSEAFFFIGRELAYPVALEGALKLKEISYDHAEGFAAGELKHGPLALVTEETPVLASLTDGSRAEKTHSNVKEVQARGAPVIAAASADGDGTRPAVDEQLPVPNIGLVEPLAANVYWQLFAYHVAANKGRPIDKPRNLAKSVTVE